MHKSLIHTCTKRHGALGMAAFQPTMYSWRVAVGKPGWRHSAVSKHWMAMVKRMPRINRPHSTYPDRKNVRGIWGVSLTRIHNRKIKPASYRHIR